MSTIEQKMNEFRLKPYDEKLKIAMNIIVNIKDRGNVQAQGIYDKISVMDKIPEHVLEAIFKDFCESVEHIQQDKVQWELHNFDNVKLCMKKLREREEQERREENCDWILDWLNNL